ncbi:hypothetical protein ACYFX5_03635 [Bremerella sp. T1]|uniref:hypothetical protein n=1 Tax=Bremerella sp. TYQ1 TaxID=3119568 RepID=UPI001CCA537B|nr:hypothetical protein [Bremerella volcania]UBM37363.1 hypothetical protein LA756_05590 [Bremerella volcania]
MATKEAPPAIETNKVYPLPLIRQNWFPGKRAWIAARKSGLDEIVFYIGRDGYAHGADLATKMRELGKKRPSAARS